MIERVGNQRELRWLCSEPEQWSQVVMRGGNNQHFLGLGDMVKNNISIILFMVDIS